MRLWKHGQNLNPKAGIFSLRSHVWISSLGLKLWPYTCVITIIWSSTLSKNVFLCVCCCLHNKGVLVRAFLSGRQSPLLLATLFFLPIVCVCVPTLKSPPQTLFTVSNSYYSTHHNKQTSCKLKKGGVQVKTMRRPGPTKYFAKRVYNLNFLLSSSIWHFRTTFPQMTNGTINISVWFTYPALSIYIYTPSYHVGVGAFPWR